MSWIVENIGRLMAMSGALTLTMVYAAIAPEDALQSTFGESLSGPVASVVVRNWGALIALVGAMLIYGARNPEVRGFALVVAGVSKTVFIVLVLAHGGRLLAHAAPAVVIDAIWVVVFAAYLFAARRRPDAAINAASARTQ